MWILTDEDQLEALEEERRQLQMRYAQFDAQLGPNRIDVPGGFDYRLTAEGSAYRRRLRESLKKLDRQIADLEEKLNA
jgi:hypothetical protein